MKKRTVLFLLTLVVLLVAACAAADYGYGYADASGNVVIPYHWDYAYPFQEDRAIVFEGTLTKYGSPDEGKYGVIDKSGREIVSPRYDDMNNYSESLAVFVKNGKYGFIDPDGNEVIPAQWDYAYSFSCGRAVVFNGTLTTYGYPDKGEYRVIDKTGAYLIENVPYRIYSYVNDYAKISKDDLYGLINLDGDIVIPMEYKAINLYSDSDFTGVFAQNQQSKYGYLDFAGNTLIPFEYDNVWSFKNGVTSVKKGKTYSLINSSGETIKSFDYDYLRQVGDMYLGYSGPMTSWGSPDEGGTHYLINQNGDTMMSFNFLSGTWDISLDSETRILTVEKNRKYGAFDADLHQIVDYQYDSLTPWKTSDGFVFKASKSDLYGILDANGRPVADLIWTDMGSYSEGLFPVQLVEQTPDFRQARWGMTKQEVMALEGSNPPYTGTVNGSSSTYIGYDTTLMGLDVIVAYYFCDQGLFQTRYILTESHSVDSKYIDDYTSIRSALTKKYGQPLIDNENWDTTRHKEYYADDKGNALSFGYLTYSTFYITLRSYIRMQMDADNYKISLKIDYESTSIKPGEPDYSNEL